MGGNMRIFYVIFALFIFYCSAFSQETVVKDFFQNMSTSCGDLMEIQTSDEVKNISLRFQESITKKKE